MEYFWEFLWTTVSVFVFVAYLFVLFHIIVDIFRDGQLGGFVKALWIIALILFPILTAIVYIIARGRGMARRQSVAAEQFQIETENYIKRVAGRSPTDQITSAKSLLDSGLIDRNEFERLKAMALT